MNILWISTMPMDIHDIHGYDQSIHGYIHGYPYPRQACAGGAKCQLCTATNEQIKDLTLIRSGFSINRCIEDAEQIFIYATLKNFLN